MRWIRARHRAAEVLQDERRARPRTLRACESTSGSLTNSHAMMVSSFAA